METILLIRVIAVAVISRPMRHRIMLTSKLVTHPKEEASTEPSLLATHDRVGIDVFDIHPSSPRPPRPPRLPPPPRLSEPTTAAEMTYPGHRAAHREGVPTVASRQC
jgi:hypothetical protein